MPRLSLFLLGTVLLKRNGQLVPGLTSRKAQALLAYLAVEAGRPHYREALAGLLWPEYPERPALASLRHALLDLRRALGNAHASGAAACEEGAAGEPLLLTSNHTVQLNPAADLWVDVAALAAELAAAGDQPSAICHLQAAVDLYRGDLLAGLSLGDAAPFEEWALLKREQLKQQVLQALVVLAALREAQLRYAEALQCAQRAIALEPWHEEARRQAMRLLAVSGRRSAALAEYETGRRLLAKELGVEPAVETVALYERIRAGTLAPTLPEMQPPGSQLAGPGRFVARERELARLDGHLQQALAGRGGVALVVGEAGSGKTALLAEFARRTSTAQGQPVAAAGTCNAYAGLGDPYLPFRQILRTLTGDDDARQANDALLPAQPARLHSLFLLAAQALVEAGPDLLQHLVPGPVLAARVCAHGRPAAQAPWQKQLDAIARRPAGERAGPAPEQADLFEQVAAVLRALARCHPLLLLLDDLQWADVGSIALLFHLAHRLAGSRILLVGAYRPDEFSLGHDGAPRPLAPLIHELGRRYGDIEVDLAQAEDRRLVEALVDSEPNRLGPPFREALLHHTAGNALFCVELLRSLKEQGGLVRDGNGRWVQGPALDWGRCPARVEAVIAGRVGRLSPAAQELLTVAAVEGAEFSSEVAARALGVEEGEARRHLEQLGGAHGLVVAQRLERVAGHVLSRYRFRHDLFQRYLYGRLDPVTRARLHEAVAQATADILGEQAQEHAAELARHCEAAGLVERAVGYWLQAGRQTARLSAHEDAIAMLRHALALLERLPDSPERARQELDVQLALGGSLRASRGWGAAERAAAFDRALALAQQLGATTEVAIALAQQAEVLRGQGRLREALAAGAPLEQLAQATGDAFHAALAHLGTGAGLYFLGEIARARSHLEQAIAAYDRSRHGQAASLGGADVGLTCLTWLCGALWVLGYPDQAQARAGEALALARTLGQPMMRAVALLSAGCQVSILRREPAHGLACAAELAEVVGASRLTMFDAWVTFMQGWVQFEQGQAKAGIEKMRTGTANWRGRRALPGVMHQFTVLIDALRQAGRVAEALRLATETLALCEHSVACGSEAELWRLKGELLLATPTAAEACFCRAIDIARRQEARSWELRATVSLARLWQAQGRTTEAHQTLSAIYAWFTEGFDTPDLQEAAALLQELLRP